MKVKMKWMALVLAVALSICLFGTAMGEAATGLAAEGLNMPVLTVTDCEWDEKGNLVSETAHTLDGQPAVNARGFHRAEYTWDAYNNPLTEAFYGLNGEAVTADGGYARTEFTWMRDACS